MVLLTTHQPGVRGQGLSGQAHAGCVQVLQGLADTLVLFGTLGDGDVLVLGEATHGHNHDRVLVHGEVAGQVTGDVDGALHLGDGAFPHLGVLRGEVHEEVAGEEVGQVGGEAHVQLGVEDIVDVDVQVLVGEVELQEVRLSLFNQRLVVVVADGQTPGAIELEVAAGDQVILQVALEEERAFFNVALHGTADQLRQVVRLQAAAGGLHGHVSLGHDLALSNVAGSDQGLGQVHAVHQLTGGHLAGSGRTDSCLNLANLLDHGLEFLGQQRDGVVVTLEGLVGGEVLLDDLCTASNGGNRHVVATLVARVTDQALANLGQAVHVGQVHVLEGCGVGRLALQQGVGCAGVTQQGHGLANLFLAAHTGGNQHGQTAGCDIAQQLVVGQVGRSNLHALNTVVDQCLHRGGIPGGAHDIHVVLLDVVEDLVHLVHAQGEAGEQVQGVLHAQVLARGGGTALTVEGVHVTQLELHGVGTGLNGQVHQFLSEINATLVVVANLGDDEGRGVLADGVLTDAQDVLLVHGERHEVAALVGQRNMVDALGKVCAQGLGVGICRSGLRVGVSGIQGAGLQGRGRVGNQPAAEIAIGERTAQNTGLVDQEDDALAVGRNLLQCGKNRVFSEDHIRGDITFNNHRFEPFRECSIE